MLLCWQLKSLAGVKFPPLCPANAHLPVYCVEPLVCLPKSMSSHTTKMKLPQLCTGRNRSSLFRTTSALVHDLLVSSILLRNNFLPSLCLTRLSSLKIRVMFCSHKKFSVLVRIRYAINSNERMNE